MKLILNTSLFNTRGALWLYDFGNTITPSSCLKKVDAYGDHNAVVSSSGWFEMEQTIKRHEYRYHVMLDNGQFMIIDDPARDHEFNEECCIVKFSNRDLDW
jgi:hypothetical protein